MNSLGTGGSVLQSGQFCQNTNYQIKCTKFMLSKYLIVSNVPPHVTVILDMFFS